ncbi:MAG TPA: hypothetical protein VN729_11275 [Ktedonobacteraceae bacterium]|nr:hypothetical protein [Ktedonobacteraceae bacterium]
MKSRFRPGLACGAFIFFLVRRGMGVAHTSPHQKENERAAGATFQSVGAKVPSI